MHTNGNTVKHRLYVFQGTDKNRRINEILVNNFGYYKFKCY